MSEIKRTVYTDIYYDKTMVNFILGNVFVVSHMQEFVVD